MWFLENVDSTFKIHTLMMTNVTWCHFVLRRSNWWWLFGPSVLPQRKASMFEDFLLLCGDIILEALLTVIFVAYLSTPISFLADWIIVILYQIPPFLQTANMQFLVMFQSNDFSENMSSSTALALTLAATTAESTYHVWTAWWLQSKESKSCWKTFGFPECTEAEIV